MSGRGRSGGGAAGPGGGAGAGVGASEQAAAPHASTQAHANWRSAGDGLGTFLDDDSVSAEGQAGRPTAGRPTYLRVDYDAEFSSQSSGRSGSIERDAGVERAEDMAHWHLERTPYQAFVDGKEASGQEAA